MLEWLSRLVRTRRADAGQLMQQALTLREAGDIAQAEALYRRILVQDPGHADACFLLGRIVRERGQTEEAVRCIRLAIESRDSEPEFHRTLGSIFFSLERWSEAVACFRGSLALDPSDKNDWNKLGLASRNLGNLAEAAGCFEHALQIAPDSPASLANSAAVCRDLGRIDESLERFRRARKLVPDNANVLSAYLFTLNLGTKASREEIFNEHLEYERLIGGRQRQRGPSPPPSSDGRLRIGYLSPDFRFHAVSFFIEPVLACHDRSRFEVTCYYLFPQMDAVSHRLKGLSERWVDCAGWSAEGIARRIEADGVDILVDLAGHTARSGIESLAAKPAPVIATWLGYLNTTGLRCVDYRITDRHSDPPGLTERFHTETLMRLPESQWCRQRPESPIAVSSLPAARQDVVSFGSFNRAAKLTPEALALWIEILQAVAGSKLLFAGVEEDRREEIRRVFTDSGVDGERLEFADRTSLERFFELHHRVDIALDAYPYSGATTTFDSLWMGVPVLTLAGEAPISRSTASILATLGMEDWVAHSKQELVAMAVLRAGNLPALAALRAGLRARLENSILMDGPRFTRQLEELYGRMWRERPAARR